jgi:cell wall-associated NlpC family hydrolase
LQLYATIIYEPDELYIQGGHLMIKKHILTFVVCTSIIGMLPSAVWGQTNTATSNQVELVIAAGLSYLGTPYEFGSSRENTTTFDCSDFIRQSFLDGIGLTLPSDSRQQGDYIRDLLHDRVITDWTKLKRGDLMFFMGYKGSDESAYTEIDKLTETIKHVGIYLGDGEILHTYSEASGGVKVNAVTDSKWEQRFLFGGPAFE